MARSWSAATRRATPRLPCVLPPRTASVSSAASGWRRFTIQKRRLSAGMAEIAVPTRDEIVALLQAVLDGTTSRTAAAEWASEVQEEIEELDTDAIDPEMWHLLRLAASLDVKSGENYLHDEATIRDWIEGRG